MDNKFLNDIKKLKHLEGHFSKESIKFAKNTVTKHKIKPPKDDLVKPEMKLEVIVFRRPNMFLVNDNMYHLIGYGELKNLFTIENYRTTHTQLVLFYPERFLNIVEQRVLISRVTEAGFKDVKIITSSVYIIQTVMSKNIKIARDELPEDEFGSCFKLSNDQSGMPDDSGLGVL